MNAPLNRHEATVAALDFHRFERLEELADTSASLWLSIAEAAFRQHALTAEVHARQVADVTRSAFQTIRRLGADTPDDG